MAKSIKKRKLRMSVAKPDDPIYSEGWTIAIGMIPAPHKEKDPPTNKLVEPETQPNDDEA